MRWIIPILFIAVITSCDNKRVFDNYIHIPEAKWHKDSVLLYNFNLDKSLAKNQIYIKVRNSIDYPYSNLYLLTRVYFPDGNVLVDTLEYEMTGPNGEFLGEGLGGLKSSILYFKKDVVFFEKGEYQISLQHGMRTEYLDGVQDVGLRIEN